MGVVTESRKIEKNFGHCAVIFAIAQLSCYITLGSAVIKFVEAKVKITKLYTRNKSSVTTALLKERSQVK